MTVFPQKRLSFGVNAAPEKYQHIISQVTSDIEGVVNTADDLIVHGKTVVEHDQTLQKLFARLQERNLALNGEKCTFGIGKVVFMGILLSKHGIGPTEEKVRASEVTSFLALVAFSSIFIPDLRPRQNLYEYYYVERTRILFSMGKGTTGGFQHAERRDGWNIHAGFF